MIQLETKEELLEVLSKAVHKTFETQLGIKIRSNWVSDYNFGAPVNLAVALNFVSSKLSGQIKLLFPKQTVLRISNKIIKENRTEIDSFHIDSAFEILNFLYTIARKEINLRGYDFQPTTPFSCKLFSFKEYIADETPCLFLISETDYGNFHLELIIKKKNKSLFYL